MSRPPAQPLADIASVRAEARTVDVNGRPFLPIYAWWVDARHFPALAASGINTALCPRADLDYARQAAAHGLYIGANPHRQLAGHPRLLFWLQEDEPDVRIPDGPRLFKGENGDWVPYQSPVPADHLIRQVMPQLNQRRQVARDLDPSRPVFLNFSYLFLERFWGPQSVSEPLYAAMATAADVISWDIYPVADTGRTDWLPLIWHGTDRLRRFAAHQPLGVFIECVCFHDRGNGRDPTEREMRNEVWQAIAAGATSIGWFTFGPPSHGDFASRSFAVSQENQRAMARINAELAAQSAFVFARETALGVRRDAQGTPEVALSVRADHQRTFALAVNLRDAHEPAGWVSSLQMRTGDGSWPAHAAGVLKLADEALVPLEVRLIEQ